MHYCSLPICRLSTFYRLPITVPRRKLYHLETANAVRHFYTKLLRRSAPLFNLLAQTQIRVIHCCEHLEESANLGFQNFAILRCGRRRQVQLLHVAGVSNVEQLVESEQASEGLLMCVT
jgi:hypothetical protein